MRHAYKPSTPAEMYDRALHYAHDSRLPPDYPRPHPTAQWPVENIRLLEEYCEWLRAGGASPAVIRVIYLPMAGHVLGLALKPHPQLDLDIDLQRGLDFLKAKQMSAEWTDVCRCSMLKFRRFLCHQRGQIETTLKSLAAKDERVTRLVHLPGISMINALAILAAIGTIERFPSAKKLVGYSGLGGRVHESGQTSRTGRITKAGRRDLRTALVKAAQTASTRHPHWKAELARLKPRLGRRSHSLYSFGKRFAQPRKRWFYVVNVQPCLISQKVSQAISSLVCLFYLVILGRTCGTCKESSYQNTGYFSTK